MKIIVLDENKNFAEITASVLKSGGFEALCMDSFDAALGEILAGDVVAVFTAMFVGGQDAGVFMSKVRSFENHLKACVPVVITSPVPMGKFFEMFGELDVFGYIERPPSAIELITVARKAAFYRENLKR